MVIRKDVIDLSLPIIAEQAFIMVMGVINAIMAGQLGKEAVSSIGMVDSINNLFIAFFSALAVGGTVVVAHYAGRNNTNSANEAARHAVLFGLLLSAAITLLIYIFRIPIIRLLFGTADKIVMDNAIIYLNITLLTYPLIALTSIAFGVLRGVGDTKTPMKITIIMNILNVIFSYVLIYGIQISSLHFSIGIPGLGVRGAALGIAAARIIGALLILITLLNGSRQIKLTISRDFKPNRDLLKSILGVGFPASVESLMFNGGKLITQVFIVGMGTASIAANYVAGSIFNLLNIPGGALSIAATTMVGQYMGRGESDEAKRTLTYLNKLTAASLLVLCVFVFPFSRTLSSMYTNSEDVINIAASLIRTTALTMPVLWSFSFLLPAGLKGAGDGKYTLVVAIFSMWVFRVSFGYILGVPLKMGVMGIWVGMYTDWLVRGILFYIRLRGEKWQKNKVISIAEESV